MSDPFLGQVIQFAGNFAPRCWAFCDGQLLSISAYSTLFSILGTTYGGDGRTTFGLPDLRSRAAIHAGTGPGLSPRQLGSKGGGETETLTINQMPSHNHTLGCYTGAVANADTPVNNTIGKENVGQADIYSDQAPDGVMKTTSIGDSGGSQPHNNMQPYLTINFIIALQGLYPSRN